MKMTITLARLSYGHLFVPTAYEDGQEKKYKGVFAIPKSDPQVKEINRIINEVAAEAYKDKAPAMLKSFKNDPTKYFFRDGDDHADERYAGHMVIGAGNKQRPYVVDRNKTPLTQADNKPEDGDYVDLSVDIWAQNNTNGKGIRCKLLGVRFRKEGDKYAAGAVGNPDDMEDLTDGAEDGDDLA